jgi:hypothetical protein
VAVNEIQRLLESLPEENAPSDDGAAKAVATLRQGPLVNTALPRGAFP